MRALPLTRRPLALSGLAAAAAVVLALSALWRGSSPAWEVERAAEGERHEVRGLLRVGEWLETGESRARLRVGRVGILDLAPRTRVLLLDAGQRRHHLALSQGELHARIWAPPGRFLVDTPSARALDLGCEYTLSVAGDGTALLRVRTGWVALEWAGRESFVPAGARCPTRSTEGPGVPLYEDATPALRDSLQRIEQARQPEERAPALSALLAEARVRDAPTLWHLLSRLSRAEVARVYERLAGLAPPPPGVTREGVLGGDRRMLDAWWEELGLGSVSFWRQWSGPDLSSR